MVHNRLVISTNRFGYQILCSLTAKHYSSVTATIQLEQRSSDWVVYEKHWWCLQIIAAQHQWTEVSQLKKERIQTKSTGCIDDDCRRNRDDNCRVWIFEFNVICGQLYICDRIQSDIGLVVCFSISINRAEVRGWHTHIHTQREANIGAHMTGQIENGRDERNPMAQWKRN